MCHDLSFSASTVEFISEILPNAIWDGQVKIDFSRTVQLHALSNPKCLVVYSRRGQQLMNVFEWGLMGDFMETKELASKYRAQMSNARSERVFDKNSVWYKIKHQRCLIAVDGFYEHREIIGWKNKVPYYIKLKGHDHFFLLGFYNYSPRPDVETGEMKGTFSVLTRTANEDMANIHNHGENKHRMPVLMEPARAIRWIDEDLPDNEMKELLDNIIASELLEYWPVFTLRTNKLRRDKKEKNELYNWPYLPPLGNDRPLSPNLSLFD